jgi:hypothetical protein
MKMTGKPSRLSVDACEHPKLRTSSEQPRETGFQLSISVDRSLRDIFDTGHVSFGNEPYSPEISTVSPQIVLTIGHKYRSHGDGAHPVVERGL